MTCRIERLVSGEGGVFLRVSGRIRAEDVDLLRDLLGSEGRVTIDLKDVVIVGRDAVKLLAFSEANGIELRNCPSYVREWIDREKTIAEPSKLKTGTKDDVEDG